MSYTAIGATNGVVDRGARAVPSCYSQSFHECYHEDDKLNFPDCSLINEAYERSGGDGGRIWSLVDKMDYCEDPSGGIVRSVMFALAGAGVGIVLGAWVL